MFQFSSRNPQKNYELFLDCFYSWIVLTLQGTSPYLTWKEREKKYELKSVEWEGICLDVPGS